jgi:hypothetical protein
MQSKKLIFILGILVLVVGTAAFVGGSLLTQSIDSVGLDTPFTGDFRSMIVPAPELPITQPDVTGPFVERQDNTIVVETKSLQTGDIGAASSENTRSQIGPLVEVVVTSATNIYRETTNPSEPLSVENQTILQTVAPGALDDLDARAMVMVWGRKSGDRVIAEVLMYSDLVAVKSAIFEDCEICP